MFYTQSTVDRADHIRKDVDELNKLWNTEEARIVPVWKDKSLVVTGATHPGALAAFLSAKNTAYSGQRVFLGLDEEIPYFALDVSSLDEQQASDLARQSLTRDGEQHDSEFLDLRQAGPLLSAQDGSLLAYARGLIYWNANTAYCTRCGSGMDTNNGGHVRSCSNAECGYQAFPRTDPAVIMLVTYTPTDGSEPLCLLGRSPSWPDGVYSTLAGFVEPGESLETAVQREVREEVSVETTDVKYVASQPWPFPRSIMLGFEAIATTTDIKCDPDEIADAKWFTREQLKGFGNWGDETPGNKLPRPDSIARFLIDRWLDTQISP